MGASTVQDDDLLLDADAKADILDDDNETALMKAAQYGGKHGAEMMRLLLNSVSDKEQKVIMVNMKDEDKRTALMIARAAAANANKEEGMYIVDMIEVLLDAGANANETKDGNTMLMWAAEYGWKNLGGKTP